MKIDKGSLIIDKNRLPYIGDALHEAGHIALMKPDERLNLTGDLEGQQDSAAIEMAVIAWTYAACLDINIDPSVVFHENGYKGASESIIQNFKEGRYFGVPILQWFQMTNLEIAGKQIQYPQMASWIRK